ncbi:23S rRNA (pseudouridine(1915)-N(3))-methyltransferase RlmH [Candidatus Gracilibacteria bacterium]|nr:23S rRNA (pseudouridine(1915)-N(3))-methyltransferase RlmH [Candidatus Gracilibacteria bacterium]
MIIIYIFADSHKHFISAISEYQKRLGRIVELRELKPVKKGNSEQIITTETEILREKLSSESGYKVILSPFGKNISTEDFGKLIETQKNNGQKIVIAVGGANGLDYAKLRDVSDIELSLGKMILPHSLALTVLLEQIYRCSEIEKRSGYHK